MKPKYMQLADSLKKDIAARCNFTGRFYSQRELMAIYGVSCATVERAMRLLCDDGLLSRVQGKGTFIVRGGGNSASSSKPFKKIHIFINCENAFVPRDPYYSGIYEGITSVAVDTEYSFIFSSFDERRLEAVMSRNDHQGMIFIAPLEEQKGFVRKMSESNLPMVLIGADWPDVDVPLVDSDNRGGMRHAVEHLRRGGHERIAYVCYETFPITVHGLIRRNAFSDAVREFGLQMREEWYLQIKDNDFSEAESAAVRQMFLAPDAPTAIVFESYRPVMLAIISELRKMKLNVPGDVSVIGFADPSLWISELSCQLPFICQPLLDIGQRAMLKLIAQLDGSIFVRREILPVAIHEGAPIEVVAPQKRKLRDGKPHGGQARKAAGEDAEAFPQTGVNLKEALG